MINVLDVREQRNLWPSFLSPVPVADLNLAQSLDAGMTMTQNTGLPFVKSRMFTGPNQTNTDRFPQGVTTYNDKVLVSFYFKYLGEACKIVLADIDAQKSCNIAITEVVNGKLRAIQTHAGGITVIGDYLYVPDSPAKTLRVFDLKNIYLKSDHIDLFDTNPITQDFLPHFAYFTPQVGEIQLETPGNVGLAYLSMTEDKFTTGNFWVPDTSYQHGGKSMIWRVPVDYNIAEFPAATPGVVTEQIEPIFPVGHNIGEPISRIQGCLIVDDILIMSRGFGPGVYQLAVMGTGSYFFGNKTNPEGHDWKNWLYGCEDLDLTDGHVVTVTEFHNDRNISFWRLNDIKKLLGELSIAEHYAALDELQDELDFYTLQIETAVSEGLMSFNRDIYLKGE